MPSHPIPNAEMYEIFPNFDSLDEIFVVHVVLSFLYFSIRNFSNGMDITSDQTKTPKGDVRKRPLIFKTRHFALFKAFLTNSKRWDV